MDGKPFGTFWMSKNARYVSTSQVREQDLTKCINICDKLLKRNSNKPFLKKYITGDEKFIV